MSLGSFPRVSCFLFFGVVVGIYGWCELWCDSYVLCV